MSFTVLENSNFQALEFVLELRVSADRRDRKFIRIDNIVSTVGTLPYRDKSKKLCIPRDVVSDEQSRHRPSQTVCGNKREIKCVSTRVF